MKTNIRRLPLFGLCIIAAWLSASCHQTTSARPEIPELFVTWQGIGPDKWASVWLIKRILNPQAKIQFIPIASQPRVGTAFDIPEAPYYRNHEKSTYQQLLDAYQPNADATLQGLKTIIHDIEVTPWGDIQHQASPAVEIAFRSLQQQYGRDTVPHQCYFDLFDNLSVLLEQDTPLHSAEAIMPDSACQKDTQISKTEAIPAIPEMAIEDLLKEMGQGKKVIFLDARERPEFMEGHIPGARNVKLRDVDATMASEVQDADIVVPYCIKDFRGYEVAKRLANYGVSNTVIMKPFGLKGWSDAKLPLQGSKQLSEQAAHNALNTCTKNPESCLHDDT